MAVVVEETHEEEIEEISEEETEEEEIGEEEIKEEIEEKVEEIEENIAQEISGVQIFFPEDAFDDDTIAMASDLLEGVFALLDEDEIVQVFVIDDGGFGAQAAQPGDYFNVVYAAIHPYTNEEITRERLVILQPSIMTRESTVLNPPTNFTVVNLPTGGNQAAFSDLLDNTTGNLVVVIQGNSSWTDTVNISEGRHIIVTRAGTDISDYSNSSQAFTITRSGAMGRHFELSNGAVLTFTLF